MKRLLLLSIFIALVLTFPKITHAAARYPIAELGNCRNQSSCYQYCAVWEHTPACWSYKTFIMDKNVLGETETADPAEKLQTLTYPIRELGLCASKEECLLYCEKRENHAACAAFAQSRGLIRKDEKKPPPGLLSAARGFLGCKDETECREACARPENQARCITLARAQGLLTSPTPLPTIPQEIWVNAKSRLGCDSRDSCAQLCNDATRQEECHRFATEAGIEKPSPTPKPNYFLEEVKQTFGCLSPDTCAAFCSLRANWERCAELGKKHGKEIPLPEVEKTDQSEHEEEKREPTRPRIQPSKPPAGERRVLPTFTRQATPTRRPTLKPSPIPSPIPVNSGCRTEDECRHYCDLYPYRCPGFVKSSPTPHPESGSDDSEPGFDDDIFDDNIIDDPDPTYSYETGIQRTPTKTPSRTPTKHPSIFPSKTRSKTPTKTPYQSNSSNDQSGSPTWYNTNPTYYPSITPGAN